MCSSWLRPTTRSPAFDRFDSLSHDNIVVRKNEGRSHSGMAADGTFEADIIYRWLAAGLATSASAEFTPSKKLRLQQHLCASAGGGAVERGLEISEEERSCEQR